ncbi:hypothetical protein ABB05_04005 [Lederbergia galactosidilytica]|uniref:Uncharacterized protein n=1 Tax=Lederbergia galactosidilytica TaxID=217031 RepID=A0A0Q9YIC5_9BACI|nr:hypothetical protein ACA29_03450 [Lederbergia galactosidilytica]OAK74738.1 hypothetical protein ABB05_04005 [Lederbergia galactosidilytica]
MMNATEKSPRILFLKRNIAHVLLTIGYYSAEYKKYLLYLYCDLVVKKYGCQLLSTVVMEKVDFFKIFVYTISGNRRGSCERI